MISMKRIDLEHVPWKELDQFWDRTIFHTLPWLEFIAKTQSAEPIVAIIKDDSQTVGYFTGLVVRKSGLKILGSPFKGWTTAYMGFNLLPEYPRRNVLETLPSFVFRDLGCHYLEMVDRQVGRDDCRNLPYAVQWATNVEIDLTQTEEQLFANMTSACRRCIRKSVKCGVSIEETSDMDFVDDYYPQLEDVFAKQSLVPTYDIERIRALIRHLLPTGHLLLLRARNADGLCIATGIFPAYNDTAYFFGGASWREHQIQRPNEPLLWYAMRYWKARGMKRFDMGGRARYKRKYGSYEIKVPRLMNAKYAFLIPLRNLAERYYARFSALRSTARHRKWDGR
jgi:lipid II:glycine glycyltransferase (peptidoglycan interpeptide bridge formation enzyme)